MSDKGEDAVAVTLGDLVARLDAVVARLDAVLARLESIEGDVRDMERCISGYGER